MWISKLLSHVAKIDVQHQEGRAGVNFWMDRVARRLYLPETLQLGI